MNGVPTNWSQQQRLGRDEMHNVEEVKWGMLEKLKQGIMGNRGTAIILSLIIVTVLFILTSFLIRKVVTNTMMVRKAMDEQASFAPAKQGILYAMDQLNTSDGYSPNYDPSDWPGSGNKNWIELDLDNNDGDDDVTTGDKECRVRVDKGDLPPDVFDLSDLDNDSTYITIESQDLPKKSVTLQAVAENTTPLLKYIRFVNSDTVLGDDFFDEASDSSTSLIQGDAPFSVLGNVRWQSGSTNDIILSGTESKTLIYGSIGNEGASSLQINGSNAKGGYSYFFDPDDPSYDDPDLFDTAEGHYFSSAHLPSSYDYSEPGSSPAYYYGGPQSASWPEIKENRYQNLASGTNCYLDNDTEINKKTEWANPGSDNTSDDNDIENEWFQDTLNSTSYHYYPYAPRLDMNTSSIGQELPNGTVNTIDYSSITNNIIYAEGDISISGIIPDGRNLTIVSGGNIFIDSNLLKETNSASLALLAKRNIVLNPTLRYAVALGPSSTWSNNPEASLGNQDTVLAYPGTATISIPSDSTNTYTIDLDVGRLVTGGRIALRGYEDGEGQQINTTLDVLLSQDGTTWNTVLAGENPDEDFHLDFTPQTFRWVRLELKVENTGPKPRDFTLASEGFDAIEIPIYAVDAALFTEDGSLEVVTGGGMAQDESILPNNNAYEPESTEPRTPSDSGSYSQRLFFWGTLAETEWTGSIPEWGYIAYAYDSNLSSHSPPALPSSVNLVSLRRKSED